MVSSPDTGERDSSRKQGLALQGKGTGSGNASRRNCHELCFKGSRGTHGGEDTARKGRGSGDAGRLQAVWSFEGQDRKKTCGRRAQARCEHQCWGAGVVPVEMKGGMELRALEERQLLEPAAQAAVQVKQED